MARERAKTFLDQDQPSQTHQGEQAQGQQPPRNPPTGTTVAVPSQPEPAREATQPELLRKVLREQQARLAEVLPKKMDINRWINVVISVNHRDGKLRLCSAASVYTAAMQGAMLGLDFNPALGQCYLIPRRNKQRTGYEASFMIGYKGLRRLALNTGEWRWIESRLVYQSEMLKTIGSFSCSYRSDREGDDLDYVHEPNFDSATRGPITHAYAVGMTKDGHRVIEIMTVDEINKEARNKSESFLAGSGPWVTNYGMMARKTPLKRLCGQGEMSADLADVLDMDNEEYRRVERDEHNDRRNRGGDALARRLGVPADVPDSTEELPFMDGDMGLDEEPASGGEIDAVADPAAAMPAAAQEPTAGPVA